MPPLPLTRACNLVDFDGICHSVGVWQQRHAESVIDRWKAHDDLRGIGGFVTILNWGSWPFVAPAVGGPATYSDAPAPVLLADGHLIIYALSVLDRIAEPRSFLRQVHAALVPGGLFLATFAIWDAHGPDQAIGAGLRSRIFDRLRWKRLIDEVRGLGFRTFGGVDLRYPGDTLYDHSLGTLVCVKETH